MQSWDAEQSFVSSLLGQTSCRVLPAVGPPAPVLLLCPISSAEGLSSVLPLDALGTLRGLKSNLRSLVPLSPPLLTSLLSCFCEVIESWPLASQYCDYHFL